MASTQDPKAHLFTEEQLKFFEQEGYLVVEKFFTKEELQPAIDSINQVVDELAQDLYQAKLITDKYEKEGFYTRLIHLEKAYPGASVLIHSRGKMTKAIADLWVHPRLLDVMEQLLGPEIAGHPIWNLRTKTPNNSQATVPWHQDCAYLLPGCEHSFQPTAWIPLLDANVQNGCMQVLAKGHKKGVVCEHNCCHADTWYISIEEKEMKEKLGEECKVVTCPIPLGGFLLINQLIPHCSLENHSDKVRWSLDLRYQRPSEPHGFWGSQKAIVFRTKDPNYQIEWGDFFSKSRTRELLEELKKKDKLTEEDIALFNPIISGPWMQRWKITAHNKHTKGYAVTEGIKGWHEK